MVVGGVCECVIYVSLCAPVSLIVFCVTVVRTLCSLRVNSPQSLACPAFANGEDLRNVFAHVATYPHAAASLWRNHIHWGIDTVQGEGQWTWGLMWEVEDMAGWIPMCSLKRHVVGVVS